MFVNPSMRKAATLIIFECIQFNGKTVCSCHRWNTSRYAPPNEWWHTPH